VVVSDDPLVLLVAGFVLTSGFGGLLAYLFQQRGWRHQYRASRDDHLREQSLKTFEEVSTLLDRRLYRMRLVYWAARRRARGGTRSSALDRELADYRSVLRLWNDNLNRNLAMVDTYFGQAARERLEFGLYEAYAAIGEELDEFVRDVSARDGEPVPVRPIGARLAELSDQVYQFNVMLLRALRDGHLGDNAPTAAPRARPQPPLLRFGSKGEQVRQLQRALRDAGAADLAVDGGFGRDTEAALRQAQRSLGLAADGIAGPATRAALDMSRPEAEAAVDTGPDAAGPAAPS
jgi:hypothetical protein